MRDNPFYFKRINKIYYLKRINENKNLIKIEYTIIDNYKE